MVVVVVVVVIIVPHSLLTKGRIMRLRMSQKSYFLRFPKVLGPLGSWELLHRLWPAAGPRRACGPR